MKAKDIATRLGCCARTVHRYANAGLISRHKLNARVVLYELSQVLAVVDAAKIGPHGNERASH